MHRVTGRKGVVVADGAELHGVEVALDQMRQTLDHVRHEDRHKTLGHQLALGAPLEQRTLPNLYRRRQLGGLEQRVILGRCRARQLLNQGGVARALGQQHLTATHNVDDLVGHQSWVFDGLFRLEVGMLRQFGEEVEVRERVGFAGKRHRVVLPAQIQLVLDVELM